MRFWERLFGKQTDGPVETRVPPRDAWAFPDEREAARAGRLLDAIEQYKQQNPKDPRLVGLREELARRFGMES